MVSSLVSGGRAGGRGCRETGAADPVRLRVRSIPSHPGTARLLAPGRGRGGGGARP